MTNDFQEYRASWPCGLRRVLTGNRQAGPRCRQKSAAGSSFVAA